MPKSPVPAHTDRRSRAAALLAKILLAALSTVLALGLAELYVRRVGPDLNTDPRLRYHSTLGWMANPEREQAAPVNAVGFRHDIPVANPEAHRRLVILGDSFTFAGRYSFAETYAGLLQERLNAGVGGPGQAGGERWDIVNLAVSGYGTAQELMALREYGLQFEPDVVVLQAFPFNDLCNNTISLAFTCGFLDFHRPYFVATETGLRRTSLYPLRARIRRWSRLFGVAELRSGWGLPFLDMGRSRKPKDWAAIKLRQAIEAGLAFESVFYSLVPEADQPEIIRTGWEITERIVNETTGLLQQRGVPVIGIVIPYYDTFLPSWPRLRPKGHPPLAANHGTETFERILGDAGAQVISMRQRILADALPPKSYFFPKGTNDKHINDFGHRMVATWIIEELRSLGVIGAEPED